MKKNIYIFLVAISVLLLMSCQTLAKKKDRANIVDFDLMLNDALTQTNRGYYTKSIAILQDIQLKFPNKEFMTINYNLGYNYFKLNNFDEAKKYFSIVLNYFETNLKNPAAKESGFLEENRKFVVMSEIILKKIENMPELRKDPYHIKEDIEKSQQKKAQKEIKKKK